MSLLGFGARSLVPDELIDGYGYDPVADTWLIRPAIPLVGRFERNDLYPSPGAGAIFLFSVFDASLRAQFNRLMIWQSAYDAVTNGIGRVGQEDAPNPDFIFKWRPQGSPDATAWTEIPGQYLAVSFDSVEGRTSGTRFIQVLGIEDHRLDPTHPDFDAGIPDLPTEDQYIEFFLLGPIAPDEHHPIIIDEITDGEFTKNVYDGLYSARDPETSAVVPTGIRYDEAAVLQMANPIRFLLTDSIDDARDWLEKHIYGVNGWIPALDTLGRISPVSRIPPTDLSGLSLITDAHTEPGPDWSAGESVINTIRFSYRRYFVSLVRDPESGEYIPASPDGPPPFAGIPRQSELEWITLSFQATDILSITRFGEQKLEIDGLAYGAIGKVPTDELTTFPSTFRELKKYLAVARQRPATDQIVVPQTYHVVPLTTIEDETGFQLFLAAWEDLLDRYALGAPTWRLPVMRSAIPGERAGDWVMVNLSWMPAEDGRRGLVGLAQIVALGDLDCAWRRPMLELMSLAPTAS